MNIKRNLLIVSLLVVLVLPTSFAFAAGIEDVKGVNYAHCPEIELAQANSLSYSGDDLYDSAADLLCAEASAEISTLSANPLSFWTPQIYADISFESAEINTFSANPLSFWTPQIYADISFESAETKDCSADCYDNY